MIRRAIAKLRQRLLERKAATWVVRIEEDRARHESGLRRWVGRNPARAELYGSAYRAYHEAGTMARKVYGARSPRKEGEFSAARWTDRRYLVLAIGLSLLVAAGGTSLVLSLLNGSSVVTEVAPKTDEAYATRIGEIRSIRLKDGSNVILDTDSVIRIAFTKQKRSVVLDHGRARFEVVHDGDRPFVVWAGGGTVTDRGTVFDVEAYKAIRVRLISGEIDVRYPSVPGKPPLAPVHLSAGQQLRFDPSMATPPEKPEESHPSDAQWVSGMKTFDDVPISQVIEEVNRYSTTKIELDDQSLSSHRVFLDLDVRDTEDVAHNLAVYLQLDIDSSRPGYLVLQSKNV
jgi:transmembrane sensor